MKIVKRERRSPLSKFLPHMRDQAAVLEDRKDLLGKGWEVICVTFVDYNTEVKQGLSLSFELSWGEKEA